MEMRRIMCMTGVLLTTLFLMTSEARSAECLLNLQLDEGPGVEIRDSSSFKNKLGLQGNQWQDGGSVKFKNFNGPGNAVRVFNENLCPETFSLTFWILPQFPAGTSSSSSQIMLVSARNDGSGWKGGFSIYVTPKAGLYEVILRIMLDKKSEQIVIGQISADKFSFVSVTYDRNKICCYINGELMSEKVETRSITYGNNKYPMEIGTTTGGNFPFYGLLSRLCFYSGALTDGEIKAMYQSSSGGVSFKKTVTIENYYASDKLYGPDYSKCRNMLQNPSFEGGGRYWKASAPLETETCAFTIDGAESRSGKSSLMLRGDAGKRELCRITSFAIPVNAGQSYTFSFYARSDKKARISAVIYTGIWPEFAGSRNFILTTQWQRYSFTFKAKNGIAAPTIMIAPEPAEDCTARFDDFQLEAGEQVTEYTEKPLTGRLLCDGEFNTVQPREKANAVFRLSGQPGLNGRLQLRIKDYLGNWIKERSIDFVLDKDGKWQMPFTELDDLPGGDFIIRAGYELSSGFTDCDYFRFAVMNYLHDDSPLKQFFGSALPPSIPTMEKALERMSHLGLGFAKCDRMAPSVEYYQALNKYGINLQPNLFYKGKTAYALEGKDGYRDPGIAWDNLESAAVHLVDYNKYSGILESCRRVTLSRPEINRWSTANEAAVGACPDHDERVKKYTELMLDIARMLKKVNPKIKLNTPSTTNISRDGISQIEDMCRAGILKEFDIIAAHPYRPRPETPDMAEDIQLLINMLGKYNFKGSISFDEDMNYAFYNIPQYGLNVTEFADFWRDMPLSYDAGTGERMMAAYNARSWLIALKYYPLVTNELWWNYTNSMLDIEMTPTLSCWAPNTLRRIFKSNCKFEQEISLGEDVRCYLFQDGDGNYVAALWNINEAVDRETRRPFTAVLPFNSSEVEVIDFVGNRINIKSGQELEIRPLPILIRNLKQKREIFSGKLDNIQILGSQRQRINISSAISSLQSIMVKVKNIASSPLPGTLSIHSGSDVKEELNLPPSGEKNIAVRLPELSGNIINHVPLNINFVEKGGETTMNLDAGFKMMLCNKSDGKIIVDGDLSDWPAGSGIKLDGLLQDYKVPSGLLTKYPQPVKWKGMSDLSATLYTMWDEQYFYLGLDITDDIFCPPPSDARNVWNYDSIQIYFDTFGDARGRNLKDYNNSDYCYTAACIDGKMQISRNQVPEWQLCFFKPGPAPKVKAAFKKSEKGYIYELAFPASELVPMQLKNNSSIGFAILVNENDNDYRKRVISLTAPGNEPYRNPSAWPTMLLIDKINKRN